MICNLANKESYKPFIKYIFKKLSEFPEGFTLESFTKDIYRKVYDNTTGTAEEKHANAINHVAIGIIFLNRIQALEFSILEFLSTKNLDNSTRVDFNELNKLVLNISKSEPDFTILEEMLGLKNNPVEELKELNTAATEARDNNTAGIEMTLSEGSDIKINEESAPADTTNNNMVTATEEYQGKDTVQADQDRETINIDNPKSPDYYKANPLYRFYYKVKRGILKLLQKPETNFDSSQITIPYNGKKGVYLTVMSSSKLTRDDFKEDPAIGGSNDKKFIYDAGEPVFVLTDVDGIPVKFNEEGQFDENGKLSYHKFRNIYGTQVKDGKVSLYKSNNIGALDDVKRVQLLKEKLMKLNPGLSEKNAKAQAEKTILDQLQIIYDIRQALKTNPDLIVKTVINGGSMGAVKKDMKVKTPLENLTIGNRDFTIHAVKSDSENSGYTYTNTDATGSYDVEITRPDISQVEGLTDTIVSILFDKGISKDKGVSKTITSETRKELLQNYIFTRTEGLDMFVNPDGGYTVKIGGQEIYRLKNKNYTSVEEAVLLEKRKSAEKLVREYFTTLAPQAEILEKDLTDLDMTLMIKGNINEVRGQFKKGYVFYNTQNNKYYRIGYPIHHINAKYQNATYPGLTLSKEGNNTIFTIDRNASYNEYIKKNFTIPFELNESGEIPSLNAFYTYEYAEGELNKIYIPVESTTSQPSTGVPINTKADIERKRQELLNKSIIYTNGYYLRVDSWEGNDGTVNNYIISDREGKEIWSLYENYRYSIKRRIYEDIKEGRSKVKLTEKQTIELYDNLNKNKKIIEKIDAELDTLNSTQPSTSVSTDINSIDQASNIIDDAIDNFDKLKALKLIDQKATVEQIEAAKKWWEGHPMSSKIPLYVLFNAVNSKNPTSIANWTLNGITLYQGADYSDLYHEAWHGFTQMFLTKEQKDELYKEVGKKSGGFTDYEGNYTLFKDAKPKQLEEYLAEDFRNYMLSGGKKIAGKAPARNKIFKFIADILEWLFGNLTREQIANGTESLSTIHDLYEKLRVGNLSEYTFSQSNAQYDKLSKGEILATRNGDIIVDDIDTKNYILNMVDSFLSEFVDRVSEGKRKKYIADARTQAEAEGETFVESTAELSYKYTATLLKTVEGRKTAYNYTKAKIKAIHDGLVKLQETETSEIIKANRKKIIDTLSWTYNNFGDINNLRNNKIDKEGRFQNVIAFHNAKSRLFTKQEKELFFSEDALNENDLFLLGRDGLGSVGGNEKSSKELASEDILIMINSLHEVDANGNTIFVEGTEVEVENKQGVKLKIGIPKLQDFDVTWNILSKKLENNQDAENMYAILSNLSKSRPNLPFKQLLNKLGPIKTSGSAEFRLWTNFWQTFNLSRVGLVYTKVNITTKRDIKGEVKELNFDNWEFTARPTKATTSINVIKKNWDYVFRMKDKGDYIGKDNLGQNYLLLDKILRKFEGDIKGRELEFFKAIGIDFDTDNEDILKEVSSNTSLNTAERIYNIIRTLSNSKYENGDSKYIIYTPSQLFKEIYEIGEDKQYVWENNKKKYLKTTGYPASGEGKKFDKLAEIQAEYSDKWGTNQVTNAEGNTQFDLTLNNFLTVLKNTLNQAEGIRDKNNILIPAYKVLISLPWMSHLDVDKNPDAESSALLNSLFDLNKDSATYGHRKLDPDTKSGFVEVELKNLSGVAFNKDDVYDEKKSTSLFNSDPLTKLVADFHTGLMNGNFELMRHSDKGTSFSFFTTSLDKKNINNNNKYLYVDTADFVSSLGRKNAVDKYILPTLNSEFKRIKKFRDIKQAVEIARKETDPKKKKDMFDAIGNTDFNYVEKGSSFVTFQGVLSPETKVKVLKQLDKNSLTEYLNTPEGFELKADIEKDIQNYFNNQIETISKKFPNRKNGTKLISNDVINKIKDNIKKNNTERGRITQKGEDLLRNTDFNKVALRSFVINSWIHNTESIKLVYGNLAQYNMAKEEFHKRNAGSSSTGTLYRTDKAAMDYVNNILNSGDTYAKSIEKTNRYYDGSLNTAIVQDSVQRSVYIEDYSKALIDEQLKRNGGNQREAEKKVFGYDEKNNKVGTVKNPIKGGLITAYAEMKEGDGQGWISFDSYRMLLNLEGKWSDSQESLYQKIVRREQVSSADIAFFFPPQKLQYWGPLGNRLSGKSAIGQKINSDVQLTAMHKFSLVPLIPTVIKDKRIQKLHDKMVREQVDYVTFESGSKISNITSAEKFGENGKQTFDLFYSDDKRNISEEPFTINPIYVNYLKNQLEIAPKFKKKVTFATQLRKLIEDGLVENGVPIDFGKNLSREERIKAWDAITTEDAKMTASPKYKIYKTYENKLRKLTELKKDQLLEEMGWKMVNGKPVGTIENLVRFVKAELERQNLGDHEIDFLDVVDGGTKLKTDASFSLSADKIEKLLNSIVVNRLIKQKINGEALIQVSTAGYENNEAWDGARNATQEELEKWGTDDLPTYRQGKDGITKAMKVKVALQGKFLSLLNLNHNDGQTIAVYDIVNGKKVLNLETSRTRLNSMIKNEEWLNKENHRKMITMVGVRIPVQGLNSMEFMEVYEFLPEEAGNIIIPPTEIVAKSGADFDIDKLTVMMPNIKTKINKAKITNALLKKLGEENPTLNFSRDNINMLIDFEKGSDGAYTLTEEDLNTLRIIEETAEVSVIYPTGDTSIEGLENDIIWNIKDILALPENFVNLITPNSTDTVQPFATKLAPLVKDYDQMQKTAGDITTLSKEDQALLNENPNVMEGTRVLEILYNISKQQYNQVGKETLGIGAVDNTFNILLNRIGAYMNAFATVKSFNGKNKTTVRQTLKFKHNTLNINGQDVISLSHLYDNNDLNRVSDIISQMMNGWVDVAKDAWIFDIQGNKDLSPTLLFMIQAGVSIENAIYMVSQPMVREYIKLKKINQSSVSDVVTDLDTKYPAFTAKKMIINKYFSQDVGYEFADFSSQIAAANNIINDVQREQKLNGIYGNVNVANISADIINKVLGNNDIDTKKMEENIQKYSIAEKNGENTDRLLVEDEYQKAIFLHFLQIEQMGSALTNVKKNMNFDTKKDASIYEAQNRMVMIDALSKEDRFPSKMIDKLITDSPISSFYIQEFQTQIWEQLLPLRTNEKFNNWLSGKMGDQDFKNYVEENFGENMMEKAILSLRNNLVPYIFQNELKQFNLTKLDGYKGNLVEISEKGETEQENLTKKQQKEALGFLKIGAFFKDGKMFIDKKSLDLQYNNAYYNNLIDDKSVYKELGLAPVSVGTFASPGEYHHFVVEREYLRNLYKNTDNVRDNIEYKEALTDAFEKNPKGQEEHIMYQYRISKIAFESFLRDKALDNIFNNAKLFTGNKTAGDKLGYIKSQYKDLLQTYPVLQVLNPLSTLSAGKLYSNIQLQDNLDDAEKVNSYHKNIRDLADSTVVKIPGDPEANKYISDFFSSLPIIGILQSGFNTKTKSSFTRLMPYDLYLRLIEKPAQQYVENMSDLLLDVYYYKWSEQNSFTNKNKTKFEDYYINEITLENILKDPNNIDVKKLEVVIKKLQDKTQRLNLREDDNIFYTQASGANVLDTYNLLPEQGTDTDQVYNNKKVQKMLELLVTNPNKIFVYNNEFESRAPFIPKDGTSDRLFRNQGQPNAFGLSTYTQYNLVESSFIKDVNGDVNPIFKEKFDAEVEELLRLQNVEGKEIVFPSSGFLQEQIGQPLEPSNSPAKFNESISNKKLGPETYKYLSQVLFNKFGYINRNYDITATGKLVIGAKQKESKSISDEIVRDLMSHCYS